MENAVQATVSSDALESINRQLSDLLNTPRVGLALGSDAALRDDLILCGVLGGKDVGKSTLINALAQTGVSVDSEEVGRGTDRTIAYVHEDSQEAVAHRLRTLDAQVPLEVSLHRADAIRNVVLIDLPDFDSEFLRHLEIVRAVAPLLDRILWVLTPRKVGDRAWVKMLNSVVKDAGNVHCVLNKVDELLSDGDPFGVSGNGKGQEAPKRSRENADRQGERFWQDQHRWVASTIERTPCPKSDDHRFLVAAAFPQVDPFVRRIGQLWDDPDWVRYAHDRDTIERIAERATAEIDRLRACVLSPVTQEESQAIKSANRRQEDRVNVARLQKHFDLERTAERLTRVCDPAYQQQVLAESFDAAYCTGVADSLRRGMRSDRVLADELLEQRVEGWPLLRLVYWPFGWLSRLLGASRGLAPARAGGVPQSPTSSANAEDPFDSTGHPLEGRIDALRARILADQAVIARQLDLEPLIPKGENLASSVRNAARKVAPQLEERLLDGIRARDRGPSIFGKFFLWFIFLWFPFLQPVLSGVLEIFDSPGAWNITHGLFKIVSALSAAHLLAGFAVVTAVFVALLAGMYARALRHVRAARSQQNAESPVFDAVDEILIAEVSAPLSSPFRDRLERLELLRHSLSREGVSG